MNGIGYRQFVAVAEGRLTSRGDAAHGPRHPRYAKRQMTWFSGTPRSTGWMWIGRAASRGRPRPSASSSHGRMDRVKRMEVTPRGVRQRERALLAALRLPKQRRFEVEESLDELGRLAESAGAKWWAASPRNARHQPQALFREGKVDELKASSERQAANLVISTIRSPHPGRNLGARRPQGHRSHRPHPGHLRPAGADQWRQAPGRAGPALYLLRASWASGSTWSAWAAASARGSRRDPAQIRPPHDPPPDPEDPRRSQPRPHPSRLFARPAQGLRLPVAALVGYTNAGKTTLLNQLTGAGHVGPDQLFVTLDPTARLVSRAGHAPFILTTPSASSAAAASAGPPPSRPPWRSSRRPTSSCTWWTRAIRAGRSDAAVDSLLTELELTGRPSIVALKRSTGSTPTWPSRRSWTDSTEWPSRPARERASTGSSTASRGPRAAGGARVASHPYQDGTALAHCYGRGRVLARSDDADGIRLEVELARGS